MCSRNSKDEVARHKYIFSFWNMSMAKLSSENLPMYIILKDLWGASWLGGLVTSHGRGVIDGWIHSKEGDSLLVTQPNRTTKAYFTCIHIQTLHYTSAHVYTYIQYTLRETACLSHRQLMWIKAYVYTIIHIDSCVHNIHCTYIYKGGRHPSAWDFFLGPHVSISKIYINF